MCSRAFYNGHTLTTAGELSELLGCDLSLDPIYDPGFVILPQYCLCSVDVPTSAAKVGWNALPTDDGDWTLSR